MTILYGLIEQRPSHPNFGHPFYVGVGTSRRPYKHLALVRSPRGHTNPLMQEVIEAHFNANQPPAVVVIATFTTREEACAAEVAAIAKYGRMWLDPNGTLCNLAPGGEGFDPETVRLSWLDEGMRSRRIAGMRGVRKTLTDISIAARQANARAPRSEQALAASLAAILRNWADPAFRAERSRSQAAAWVDPEKRAKMLEGRSEGIAQSWNDPETREKRSTNISAAIESKWADDPDYAARSRAGLAAAWSDPEKKAARVEQMLANRPEREFTEADRARQSAVMTAVNASISTEDRSAMQTKSWTDPVVAAARKAGIKKAAQDPALKAARIANMLAGKRRKAAAKAQAIKDGVH